ncbi:MAG: dockerin type I domain-containing protein [Phycisphaerales bacterium]
MNRFVLSRSSAAATIASALVASAGSAIAAPLETGMVRAGSPLDLRAPRSDARTQTAQAPRGLLGPVLMRDNLEAYTVGGMGGAGQTAPPSFLDPPDFPWGLNNLRGQGNSAFVSLVDLSGAPLGGSNGVVNASQAIRIFTAIEQFPGGIFTGANLRWDPVLTPGVDQPAVGSHEGYLTTRADVYTFETVNGLAGFISSRLYWGGPCNPAIHGDCADPENPVLDALDSFFFLGIDPDSFTTGLFMPSAYCVDQFGAAIPGCVPPSGYAVGDPAEIPLNNWFRLAWSFNVDGTMTALLDRQDGSGLVPIAESLILTTPSFNRVGWNTGFLAQDASFHIDNIEASGYVFDVPVPPALECPFVDDIEWLNPGPVLGQTDAWFAPLSGAVRVVIDGAQGQVLEQSNLGFGEYAQSTSRALPEDFAGPMTPMSVCVDAFTTGETGRAFVLESDFGVATRVFLGLLDETDPGNPVFDPTVYVQINPNYDPAFDGRPIVGVDVESTGYQWTTGQYRELCMTIDAADTLTVRVDGAQIYLGSVFFNLVSEFAVESDNNEAGQGDLLRIDNIEFSCLIEDKVEPPPLTLPYCNDYEWAAVGMPVGSNGVVIESVDLAPNGESQVVAMPNVFRDTPQAPVPDFNAAQAFVFTQFTAETPSVVVDDSTWWRVSVDLAMNDFLTSRGVAPAQLADVGGGAELNGILWYHAPNDRFYLFASPDNAQVGDDIITIDTGFTRAGLGIAIDTVFEVVVEYVPSTGKIVWSINGTVVGSTNPILGTDDLGNPRLHRNLDYFFAFSGDDDTAPGIPPLSTMYLDNLCVQAPQDCPADLNGDGVVNFTDLNTVISNFGASGEGVSGDVTGDGVVNFTDLNLVLSAFGGDGCN